MPTRGGARGGAAEFSWEKVKESKDREFYLGNSVAAPTGRWQDGRDINWYNKDASASSSAAEERREELRKIKEAETAALYAKLGKPPPASTSDESLVKVGDRLASGSSATVRREVTGANGAPLEGAKSRTWGKGKEVSEADKKLARKFARDEVRRKRAEVDEDDGERKRSRRDDGRDRHSSSRRHRDDEEDRERRHGRSHRHRDDERDGKESRRHRHHHSDRRTSRSRSRSRSPESSSRHLHHHRHRDEDRYRSKHSRCRDEEESRHRSSSHREREPRSHRSGSPRD